MAIGNTKHSVTEYGAVGDGVTDDTAAFQAAIDALPARGGVVEVPQGVYLIDPIKSVRLRSRIHLVMQPDAKLLCKPNDKPRCYVLWGQDIEDVMIEGGQIVGDRDEHTYVDTGTSTRTHEWGHGVALYNVTGVQVRNVHISKCTGDGMSVGGSVGSKNVEVVNVTSTNNRRQGLTIGRVQGMVVRGCMFTKINGTNPQAAIDIEPDSGLATDILIEGCILDESRIGLSIYTRPDTDAEVRNVVMRGCQVHGNKSGVYAVRVNGFDIVECSVQNQLETGIRLAAGITNAYIEGCVFANNYNRGATTPINRTDFVQFGATTAVQRDIYITSELGGNNVGRNRYE